jgi:hypothetical protein
LKSEKNFGMLETHIDLFEEEKNWYYRYLVT